MPIFANLLQNLHRKSDNFCQFSPNFRVKSVKIYTGKKNLHGRRPWRPWQISGMTPDQISVIVQVYNLFALPAMPISWSGRWGETRRDTKTLVGLPEQTQIMPNVVHPLQTANEDVMLGWQESSQKCPMTLQTFANLSPGTFVNLWNIFTDWHVRSGLCRPVEGAQGERSQGGAQSGWGRSRLGKLQRAAETEKVINICCFHF